MVLEEEGIGGGRDRGGGGGAAGWEWTGAGEDGAENREDGEPRLLVSSLRIGDGVARVVGRESEEVLGNFLGGSPDVTVSSGVGSGLERRSRLLPLSTSFVG